MNRNELKQIIRDLSERYDKDSKNTYLSIYIDKTQDKKYLDRRENICMKLLKDDEQENFKETLAQIKSYIKKSREQKLAVFASNKHEFLHGVPIPLDIHNFLIVDSSPYIRPLARIQDEWEDAVLILLNSHSATLYQISLGSLKQQHTLSKDIMNKHKKGGMSQARFQRLRKGAIHHFFKEVEEALEDYPDQKLVLAGPGTAKQQFKDSLPAHIQDRIIHIIDIDIDDEQQLFESSLEYLLKNEQQQSTKAVQRLKAEILKDGLAVYGIKDTLTAAKNGQIELLILQKDYKLKGCLCEHCQLVRAGPIKDCPICGQPTSEADVLEEIIEFAERTSADIEFTDDEEIANLGHVGALLRYK